MDTQKVFLDICRRHIAARRMREKIPFKDLSLELGISICTLAKIRRDWSYRPSLATAHKLAQAFGYADVADMLSRGIIPPTKK